MVRALVQAGGDDEPTIPPRFRERHRLARHREFLDAARRIVNTDGQAALTMQRVTDDVGSSVGGIYIYFPSKNALIAELQREALEVLTTSYLLGQARLDLLLAERDVDPATAALARGIATARFWIASEETFPSEIELSRRLLAGAQAVIATDEASRVLPAVLRLLEEGRQRLDAAAELGAIDPANNIERAVVVIAAITGVLLTSKLGRWDDHLFDGRHLATELIGNLFAGWGATRDRLAAVDELLAAFSQDQHRAPPVDAAQAAPTT
ncbi:hypothetical protein BH20ACT2_BH20ACT2_20220 [soil metagenome]